MTTQTWFYQKCWRDGGTPFWDTYVHAECRVIRQQERKKRDSQRPEGTMTQLSFMNALRIDVKNQ